VRDSRCRCRCRCQHRQGPVLVRDNGQSPPGAPLVNPLCLCPSFPPLLPLPSPPCPPSASLPSLPSLALHLVSTPTAPTHPPPSTLNDSPKVDIWSVGVVLRECTQKDPPYFTETVFRAMYLISTKGVQALDKKVCRSVSTQYACIPVVNVHLLPRTRQQGQQGHTRVKIQVVCMHACMHAMKGGAIPHRATSRNTCNTSRNTCNTSPRPALFPQPDGSKWSKELVSFDHACLRFEAKDRHSAEDALKHPFLSKACNPAVFEQVVTGTAAAGEGGRRKGRVSTDGARAGGIVRRVGGQCG